MEHFSPVKVKPVSSFSSPVIDDNSLLDRNLAADDFYASSQSWGSQKWIVDNKKNEMKSLIEKAEHLKLQGKNVKQEINRLKQQGQDAKMQRDQFQLIQDQLEIINEKIGDLEVEILEMRRRKIQNISNTQNELQDFLIQTEAQEKISQSDIIIQLQSFWDIISDEPFEFNQSNFLSGLLNFIQKAKHICNNLMNEQTQIIEMQAQQRIYEAKIDFLSNKLTDKQNDTQDSTFYPQSREGTLIYGFQDEKLQNQVESLQRMKQSLEMEIQNLSANILQGERQNLYYEYYKDLESQIIHFAQCVGIFNESQSSPFSLLQDIQRKFEVQSNQMEYYPMHSRQSSADLSQNFSKIDKLNQLDDLCIEKYNELGNSKRRLANVTNQITTKESYYTQLAHRIENKLDKIAQLSTKIKKLKEQVQSQENQLAQISNAKLQTQKSIQDDQRQVKQLEQQIEQIQHEISQKHLELDMINTAIAKLKQEAQQFENQQLQNQNQLKHFNQAQVQNERILKQQDDEMGQKNVKLASMEGNLQKLQENILEKEAIIESLINKRQIYQKDVDNLSNQYKHLQAKYEQLVWQHSQLQNTVQQLHDQKTQITEGFQQQELSFKERIIKYQQGIQNGEQTLKRLINEVQKLQTTYESLSQRNSALISKQKKFEYLAKQQRQQYDQVSQQLKLLQGQLVQLKEQEGQALITLALSGQELTPIIKQKITTIIQNALAYQNNDQRNSLITTPVRQNTRYSELDNSVLFSIASKEAGPVLKNLDDLLSAASSVDFSKLAPETENLNALLHKLEATQDRLRQYCMVRKFDLDD